MSVRVIFAYLLGITLTISLALLVIALKFFLIGFVVYFFLAVAGVFPPVDFIPFIPYI